jgi:cob(I)alamin adenosyltransferase
LLYNIVFLNMKIYTKTGDKGLTSLIGGVRVPKHHIRIESYGTVDELNSYLGLVKDVYQEAHSASTLSEIQDRLFTIGSHLASAPEKAKMKVPDLLETDVTLLETEIDKMDKILPPLTSFILPGGHAAVSHCHIARCICRRAERICVQLSEEEMVEEIIIRYLNRLSDYLFMLCRMIAHDLKVPETAWKPRM